EDQDPDLWDADQIAEGRHLVVAALCGPDSGPNAIQAAIAALHAEAAAAATTDWPQMVALYEVLTPPSPQPAVPPTPAAAVAMREGREAGLVALDALAADAVSSYHPLPAARADLLRKLGRAYEAAVAYRTALKLAKNERERAFFRRRLAEL